MSVEVIAIGGYEEVGRNMTAVKVGEDVIIFDMGIHLDRISIHEDTDIDRMHSLDLIERGVIPDDTLMKDVDGKVKGIVFSHGHLDHIGAVAKLAHRYDAPLIGTPYTAALIQKQINGERKFKVNNPIKTLNPGGKMKLSEDITLEFVQSTHSIPQAVFPVLHTPEGIIVYALDFKFDNHQKVSPPPDYRRLKELGRKGVLALIVESTNIKDTNEVKTYSERIARNILEDLMRGPLYEKTGMIVTTFSSHVERVQTIADIAKKSHREILFLGRSMERFCGIAESQGILKLPKNSSIYGSPKAVNKALMKAEDNREKYLLVTTGHQGEPDALLPRIANGKTPFNIKRGDNVIISAPIIPNPTNAANRHIMERRLKASGARIYANAHVSGHAGREDHRDFIRMLKPQHIIPAHGDLSMLSAYGELAEEEGYRIGNNVHILRNAQAQVFNG
ncbi:ribonuclease J 1 [Methanobrevibacter woesei]|uniref:Ribonuclease J n=1 Tax=Methanobrevibacter woesei TaxID=190976 RepID=A0A2U1S7G7_9EURY|nr:RNase J family beta-CASP ribonuclease [Methanobrevibacter woesei]MCC9262417.1 RNase J family beta-CASP ribonuclease [Methanobrevibacter woesei]PWB86067.1 ribonuclease J 1 [Methanobrevibacter woesei]